MGLCLLITDILQLISFEVVSHLFDYQYINLIKFYIKLKMISKLAKQLTHFMRLKRPFITVSKILYSNSNKKSIQQQSYFESRLSVYDKHKYPHFKPTLTVSSFISLYSAIRQHQEKGESGGQKGEKKIQKIVGRISSIRKHGKTTFIDVREQHKKLQIAIKSQKQLDVKRGDVIGVTGEPFVTKKGELSLNCINVSDLILLAPCMWMLPEYETLKDPEARFRNKPLDLITNSSSVEMIRKRASIISNLRNQLLKEGYIQVQTPILSPSCGGAIAKPFITYHNDHKTDLFLRIAPELYLKKLLIGGISKVFEIGKNFRNQSIDQTHNPQFTSCQLYCAYQDYKGMMNFTHNLLNNIAKAVNGSTIIRGKNNKGEPVDIDLSQKWKQIDFMKGLQEALGIKLPIDFQNPATVKFYDEICHKNSVQCEEPRSIERLLDKLAGKYLQTTHEPFMIVNHPKVMSPLAKPIPDQPHLTQRFELFINGWEVVNSYTELNDPRIQKQNTPTDIDFVEALQYGLTPCAGWGIGLDRFIMILTNAQRIQEVLAFPLLREMFPTPNDKTK